MRPKDFLRPPYRFAKRMWWGALAASSAAELRLGIKPMQAPRCKVEKSSKLGRILLVAMKYDGGVKEHGPSYEYYNFFQTLKSMSYDVEFFDFLTLHREKGKIQMNKMLWEAVQDFKPDLVFFYLTDEQLDKQTVRRISEETPSVTLNWFSDDDWRFHNFSKFWAPNLNFCATAIMDSVGWYKSLGYQNVAHAQWAANPAIFKHLGMEKDIEVSFVGQPHSNRREMARHLQEKGIGIQCFGYGWDNGRVDQGEMVEIFNRSKINLNFTSNSMGYPAQMKARFFEITCCGGFLLSEYARHIEDYFAIGKEIETFDGKDEMLEKIARYLEDGNSRDRIAKAGHERTHAEHTYEKRFQKLFSEMGFQTKRQAPVPK